MVPGIGGGELILIAVVALVVVGPKDLPKLLRQLGRFVGKMRRMADEFRTSFEDMARQSELDDLRKEVDALRSGKLNGLEDMSHQMKSIESDINSSLQTKTQVYNNGANIPAPVADTEMDINQIDADREAMLEAQMEGLPPQGKPEKPKRVRKAPVAKVEPTVTPVKRTRAKKTVTKETEAKGTKA